MEGSIQLDSSSRFDTIPACETDGRTDGHIIHIIHDGSIYCTGIASSVENYTS